MLKTDYSIKTDIWSIGVVIFYIFTNLIVDFKLSNNIEKLEYLKNSKLKYCDDYITILKKIFVKEDLRIDIDELLNNFEKIQFQLDEQNSQLSNVIKIIGDFEYNLKTKDFFGSGKIIFYNGDVYTGDIKNGTMNGNGKITFANGNILEGEFLDNNKIN
jgi:serine/threonine protein kinase